MFTWADLSVQHHEVELKTFSLIVHADLQKFVIVTFDTHHIGDVMKCSNALIF